MNDLERYFHEHDGRMVQKWSHYFKIYDSHLLRYRNSDVHVVEFGVNHGGSLQLWRKYFGPRAKIYGIDINPNCKQLEESGVKIFIGDQGDRSFLRRVAAEIPRIDVLIDDGGHTMQQQIATFEELFPSIEEDGVYLCEDTHTSYWPKYGGGYRRRGSFIEYSKGFIDQINAWHSQQPKKLQVDDFTRSVHSVTYYDSVVVIQKQPTKMSSVLAKGTAAVADYIAPQSSLKAARNTVKQAFRSLTNRST